MENSELVRVEVLFSDKSKALRCDYEPLVKWINEIINERDAYYSMLKEISDRQMDMAQALSKFSGQKIQIVKSDDGQGFIKVSRLGSCKEK